MKISENIIEAVKVIFLESIFDDDFPERGMKAWLTDIVKDKNSDCYKLYFDFTEFQNENEKYLKADYYNDRGIPCLTARDVGIYTNKYSVYFGDINSEKSFEEQINKYLKIIE